MMNICAVFSIFLVVGASSEMVTDDQWDQLHDSLCGTSDQPIDMMPEDKLQAVFNCMDQLPNVVKNLVETCISGEFSDDSTNNDIRKALCQAEDSGVGEQLGDCVLDGISDLSDADKKLVYGVMNNGKEVVGLYVSVATNSLLFRFLC